MTLAFVPEGVGLAALRGMSASALRTHAELFLVRHTPVAGAPVATLRTRETRSTLPRGDTGDLILLAYALRKSPGSEQAWISVGRTEGNDIVLRDDTVSKFHAFFQQTGVVLSLQDGGSRNGTFVDDRRVAARGQGPATPVRKGQMLRFGTVPTVLLDAQGVLDLLGRLDPGQPSAD